MAWDAVKKGMFPRFRLRTSGFAAAQDDSAERLRRMEEIACRELQQLSAIQHQALRGYFRLADTWRVLGDQRISSALERERQRIGRELHTGAGQALAGIHIHLTLIEEALENPPAPVRASLERAATLLRSAIDDVQGVSRSLYAPAWQSQPLAEALRRLWENSGIPEKFEGSFEAADLDMEPPAPVRAALYHSAQEALANVIRHSHARRVSLSLRQESGRTTLTVEDDGGDKSGTGQFPESRGIGLRSVRDAVRQAGGQLHIETGPQGTRLTIWFCTMQ